MAPKIISAAILSMVVVAAYGIVESDVGMCSINNGVATFNPNVLCGRSFYTAMLSGKNVDNITCQVSKFDCSADGKITHTIITLIKGVEQPVEVHNIKNVGAGVLTRDIPAASGVGKTTLKEVVLVWSEKTNDRVVYGSLICNEKSNDDDHSMRMILVSHPDIVLSDESKMFKRWLPFPGFYSLPFACQKEGFFPPTPNTLPK